MQFSQLGLLPELLRAVDDKGYSKTTPIQEKAIPAVLSKRDIMASAQTGTGKTAAFVLPLLQLLSQGRDNDKPRVRVLIITPTRELAAQIQDSVLTYGRYLEIKSMAVFGGVNIKPQIRQLRIGTDILIATPGRLLDLVQQKAVHLGHVGTLVLDEADRMLDMGFIPDIKRIQALVPKTKRSLLFSATFSNDIRALAKSMLNQPLEIDVAPRNTTIETVNQKIHPVDKKVKSSLLIHLIKQQSWRQVLVFTRTKHGANRLVKALTKAGISSDAIHGNKTQGARTRALAAFKNHQTDILVATDIAARGIDIVQLPLVVNFDLPNVAEDYVHRIGRTGRAGIKGSAISLVSADEIKQLRDIERFIKMHLQRDEVDGFEPIEQLSESRSLSSPAPARINRRMNKTRSKQRVDKRGSQAQADSSGRSSQDNRNQSSGQSRSTTHSRVRSFSPKPANQRSRSSQGSRRQMR